MTRDNAQRIQGALGLLGTLGIAGVKLYALGWLDDWRIVSGVFAGLVAIFAFFWTKHELRLKRDRAAMNELWESRRQALGRTSELPPAEAASPQTSVPARPV